MSTQADIRFPLDVIGVTSFYIADMPVPEFLKESLTLYEIAEQYWDLKFIPTQYAFSLLARISPDKLERDKCIELSSPEGQEEWLNYCRRPRRTIIEVLQDFHKSTSKLTIDVLFELFSTIKPRAFSVASGCRHTDGRNIDILAAVVKYYSKLKKPRLGLCSNWMKTLKSGDRIYGWMKTGTFVFPSDEKTPCILIGPGTGLAPFRSLIQERVVSNTASRDTIILFFGCRYKYKDFHFRRELESLADEGLITLVCAFSRDQDSKIYVQHKVSESRDLLWALIHDKGAKVYISGNAKNMPDNVRDAFVEAVFQQSGGMSQRDALQLIRHMESGGQLQIEAW